jgi:hypothetical protein
VRISHVLIACETDTDFVHRRADYVTKHVVPPKHVAAWAWIIGWCNFLGQAAGVASLAYTISQMILATVVMHTMDGDTPTFLP